MKNISHYIELLLESPGWKTFFSVIIPIITGVLSGLFVSEISTPAGLNWSKFYHQSPELYFVKNIKRDRFNEIVKKSEKIFDEHNRIQKRLLIINQPIYTIKRIIKNKYYTPKNILKLFNMVK